MAPDLKTRISNRGAPCLAAFARHGAMRVHHLLLAFDLFFQVLRASFGSTFLSMCRADLIHRVSKHNLAALQIDNLNACLFVRMPVPEKYFFGCACFLGFGMP